MAAEIHVAAAEEAVSAMGRQGKERLELAHQNSTIVLLFPCFALDVLAPTVQQLQLGVVCVLGASCTTAPWAKLSSAKMVRANPLLKSSWLQLKHLKPRPRSVKGPMDRAPCAGRGFAEVVVAVNAAKDLTAVLPVCS